MNCDTDAEGRRHARRLGIHQPLSAAQQLRLTLALQVAAELTAVRLTHIALFAGVKLALLGTA